jgi:hypothetical protein
LETPIDSPAARYALALIGPCPSHNWKIWHLRTERPGELSNGSGAMPPFFKFEEFFAFLDQNDKPLLKEILQTILAAAKKEEITKLHQLESDVTDISFSRNIEECRTWWKKTAKK